MCKSHDLSLRKPSKKINTDLIYNSCWNIREILFPLIFAAEKSNSGDDRIANAINIAKISTSEKLLVNTVYINRLRFLSSQNGEDGIFFNFGKENKISNILAYSFMAGSSHLHLSDYDNAKHHESYNSLLIKDFNASIYFMYPCVCLNCNSVLTYEGSKFPCIVGGEKIYINNNRMPVNDVCEKCFNILPIVGANIVPDKDFCFSENVPLTLRIYYKCQ